MIKINEEFTIGQYARGWFVDQYSDGVSRKTKEPIRTKRQTYHLNLSQCLKYITDQKAKECETVEELKELLVNAHKMIDEREIQDA